MPRLANGKARRGRKKPFLSWFRRAFWQGSRSAASSSFLLIIFSNGPWANGEAFPRNPPLTCSRGLAGDRDPQALPSKPLVACCTTPSIFASSGHPRRIPQKPGRPPPSMAAFGEPHPPGAVRDWASPSDSDEARSQTPGVSAPRHRGIAIRPANPLCWPNGELLRRSPSPMRSFLPIFIDFHVFP